MKFFLHCILFLFLCLTLNAQEGVDQALNELDKKTSFYGNIAHIIWGYAEMGYQEKQSSALLQNTLKNEGFTIKTGVADIPTAFIAEYGSGSPVIGILGEYDALPGLSQQAVPVKESAGGKAGHACGHNLFGTASTAMNLFSNLDIIEKAKTEFLQARGKDFQYIPLLGDRTPALDYRN